MSEDTGPVVNGIVSPDRQRELFFWHHEDYCAICGGPCRHLALSMEIEARRREAEESIRLLADAAMRGVHSR